MAGASKANRTIVGMPANALPNMKLAPPAGAPQLRVGNTIVGAAAPGPLIPAPPAGAPMPRGGTLLGVARPGIAPLAPGEDDGPITEDEPQLPDPPNYEPARELGATLGPSAVTPEMLAAQAARAQAFEDDRRRRRRRMFPAPPKQAVAAKPQDDRTSRRALAIVVTAGVLALAAVLVALFWHSAKPLTARAKADAAGHEGVELYCESCPDGTKLTIAGSSATTTGGTALVTLPTALSVGENRLKVDIDRPGNGRDETVNVSVNVAYRMRTDLATLQAEKPSFQILAEVASGTTVTIDGHKMALSAGHGVENVDVTDVCTGLSAEVKTLSRSIPYEITPDSGPPEQGALNVSVGIVPLSLDAPVAILGAAGQSAPVPLGDTPKPPAPHVVIDGPSFLLAGRTMKGAEVLAAGKPITVHPDGTFGQVMNVSSVGATQIEVRARMPGMAPRLAMIKVRRVENLDKAAREFTSSESPLGFADVTKNVGAAVGKAVTLSGEISESKRQGYQTVMLLEVSSASGCVAGASCTVRLVQGAENPAKKGDALRVFGHVSRAFQVPGRPDIPEIEVDFTLRDGGGKPLKDRK
jgi:hypothetical protein